MEPWSEPLGPRVAIIVSVESQGDHGKRMKNTPLLDRNATNEGSMWSVWVHAEQSWISVSSAVLAQESMLQLTR